MSTIASRYTARPPGATGVMLRGLLLLDGVVWLVAGLWAWAYLSSRIVEENATVLDVTPMTELVAPWIGLVGVLHCIAAVLAFRVVERIERSQARMWPATDGSGPPPRPDLRR